MIKEKRGYYYNDALHWHWAFASKMKTPLLKVDTTDQLRFSRKNSAPSGVEVVYLSYGDVVAVRDVVAARDMVAGSYVMNFAVKAVPQTAEDSYVMDFMRSFNWPLFKIPSYSAPERKARLTGPIQFINKLLETWHLEPKDAVLLLGHEPSEIPYVLDLLNGRIALKGRDTKDRIAYLFRIRKTLSALFPSEEVENKWLHEQHAALGGQTPMQRLLEGSMENLLLVKEFVEEAAGR